MVSWALAWGGFAILVLLAFWPGESHLAINRPGGPAVKKL